RAALEDDLLDPVIAAIEHSDCSRVQGRALRVPAQVVPHAFTPILLARFLTAGGRDAVYRAPPLLEQRLRFGVEVGAEDSVRVLENRISGQEIPLVRPLREGRRCQEKKCRVRRTGLITASPFGEPSVTDSNGIAACL